MPARKSVGRSPSPGTIPLVPSKSRKAAERIQRAERARQGKKDAARARDKQSGKEEEVARKYAEIFIGGKSQRERAREVVVDNVSYLSPGGMVEGLEAMLSLWNVWFDAMSDETLQLVSLCRTDAMHALVVFRVGDLEVTDKLALGASAKIVTIHRAMNGDAHSTKGMLAQKLEDQVKSLEATLATKNEAQTASENRLTALVKLARAGTAVVSRTVSPEMNVEAEERTLAMEEELNALRNKQREKEVLWRELLRKKDAQLTLTLTKA